VAEAVACGTLACVVVPMAEAGVAKQSLETLQFAAFRSDRDSIRALTILGLLLEFIGEMADHVNEFERILRK
jgi:Na+-translocating ferredoxin:NAD+ oxidoreductase RnfE subunit